MFFILTTLEVCIQNSQGLLCDYVILTTYVLSYFEGVNWTLVFLRREKMRCRMLAASFQGLGTSSTHEQAKEVRVRSSAEGPEAEISSCEKELEEEPFAHSGSKPNYVIMQQNLVLRT